MTLPDRETVRAVGRPQFAALLQQQGRPVTIRRAGQPEAKHLALALPVLSESRKGEAVRLAPSLWKLFFAHDVQEVATPGFTLVLAPFQGQAGLDLTPTTPAVDVADQGVVLMLHASPLADRTRTELLRFTIAQGLVQQPGTGNMVPGPGLPLEVPVRLVASDDPRIRDMVGADAAEVALVGRWGTLEAPQQKPPQGVRWGSTSPLVLDGQSGTLTIKLAYPDPDLAQEQQFGARFVAVWRAGP